MTTAGEQAGERTRGRLVTSAVPTHPVPGPVVSGPGASQFDEDGFAGWERWLDPERFGLVGLPVPADAAGLIASQEGRLQALLGCPHYPVAERVRVAALARRDVRMVALAGHLARPVARWTDAQAWLDDWVALMPLFTHPVDAHVALDGARFPDPASGLELDEADIVAAVWSRGSEQARAGLTAASGLSFITFAGWHNEALQRAGADPSPLVRAALAGTRHLRVIAGYYTPERCTLPGYEQVWALLSDPAEQVRVAAWTNLAPLAPVATTVAGFLAAGGALAVVAAAAARETMSGGLWPDVTADPSPLVRALAPGWAGAHPTALTAAQWQTLTADKDAGVLLAVAGSTGAPPFVLRWAATHPDPGVRAAVAAVPHLPPALVALLAGDQEVAVRVAVAGGRAVTGQALSALLGDPVETVRVAAAARAISALAA